MTEVVSVRFKKGGKNYFFNPEALSVSTGDNVLVETSKGLEYAICAKGNFQVEDDMVIPPLRSVVRIATEADKAVMEGLRKKEQEAFSICAEKIQAHGLDMKLVNVECNFEGSKILFFFTSDGRVDFRGLVKELAGIFKTRIELSQIGVRDEAKMVGGLGICGRGFCCSQFLDEFHPVSIKMAKTQNLSLNPTKISGTCGRLMCCLKYEQDAYEELVRNAPKADSYVETPEGNGTIKEVNLLRQYVKVCLDNKSNDPAITVFPIKDVTFIKTGKQRRADLAEAAAHGGARTAGKDVSASGQKTEPPRRNASSGKAPIRQVQREDSAPKKERKQTGEGDGKRRGKGRKRTPNDRDPENSQKRHKDSDGETQ